MPKERQPTATIEIRAKLPDLRCQACNADLGDDKDGHTPWRLKPGQAIHHCDGSPCAFGAKQIRPHHTLNPWPNCWKCRQPLGCPKCVTGTADQVFCEGCLVWGTLDAFLLHGPIPNSPMLLHKRLGRRAPQADEYPSAWARQYTQSERDFYEQLDHPSANTDEARRMLDVFSATVPERYAESILKAWESKQAS